MRPAAYALSVFAILLVASPSFAQAPQKETKAVRLEHLQTALANQNKVIDLLSLDKTNSARQHKQEFDTAAHARDAILRLINNVEGRDENAGIDKAHNRDKQAAKSAVTVDYPTALQQMKQLLEENYNILSQDPGKNNDHRKNALKYIDEVHKVIVPELEQYERTHPAPAAAPAAAANPANPAAGTPADTVATLDDVISHFDHAIDDIAAEPSNDPLKQKTLAAVTNVRDTTRRLVDSLQNRDATKDIEADHARDASKRQEQIPDYYHSLLKTQEYLHNDHIRVSRLPEDPQHLRTAVLQAMDQAGAAVQQQLDAYRKAHPDVH
jgi:hypothetical protein